LLHELTSSAKNKSSEGFSVVRFLLKELPPSHGIFTLIADAEVNFAALRNDEGVVKRLRFQAAEYLNSFFFSSMSEKPPMHR
jgi:hypothetical protein